MLKCSKMVHFLSQLMSLSQQIKLEVRFFKIFQIPKATVTLILKKKNIWFEFGRFDVWKVLILRFYLWLLEFVLVSILFFAILFFKATPISGNDLMPQKRLSYHKLCQQTGKKLKFLSCWEHKSVLRSSNWRNKPKTILFLSQFSAHFFLETGGAL